MVRINFKCALAVLLATSLGGCASTDYEMYARTQQAIAQSHAQTETARLYALAEIARSGDATAKVAAVMSMQIGNTQPTQPQIAAPTSPGESALRWASILVPGVVQVYGIQQNTRTAMNASNNSAAVSMNTNGTMLGMSQSGVSGVVTTSSNTTAALADVSKSGLSNLTAMGQTGVIGAVVAGQSGIAGLTDVSKTGIGSMNTLGQAGITGVAVAGQSGIAGLTDVSKTGIGSMNTLGQAGITGTVTTGQIGITGVVDTARIGLNVSIPPTP